MLMGEELVLEFVVGFFVFDVFFVDVVDDFEFCLDVV